MSDNPRKVTLVVFGHVGNGKSTLGNTLIGDNTGTSFRESPNPEEETIETIGKTGTFDGVEVCVIDTPGYGGGEGNTARHIVNMANFIIANTEVQVFVLVLNYQLPRLDEDLRNFFQLITSMYPGKPWLDHLCVVWTRFYPEHTDDDEKNARRGVPKMGIKMFMPEVSDARLDSIPQFFVDSVDARRAGDPGRLELAHLLAWAATKPPVRIMGAMRVKKGDPITERRTREIPGPVNTVCVGVGGHEFGFFGHRSHFYEDRQTITTIYEERERQEYTSGDPTFTEWHEVRSEKAERVIRNYHD